ncbi:hypothetical protein [Arthrobacter sp. K5]|uniref:Uncharacterized protein n=1 Tax=Arthrobacter sp. K5 TaxID=2839623 RepID=A0AAU8ER96_9MICC
MSSAVLTHMRSLRRGLLRVVGLAVLTALVAPLLMAAFAPSAHADGEEPDNYSLYALSSNASTYFSQENAPKNDGLHENWHPITSNPATGGAMLGYADPEFSPGDIVGWFFAEVSGSSQTIAYDTFHSKASDEQPGTYSGMLDYAHFGAANADLGLDTMSSGVGGQIVALMGGGIIWALYLLALAVGTVFWLVIQLLKALNPFMWFYQAVAGVTVDGAPSAHQQEMADGMTGGDAGGGALAGLQHCIASWYGLLQSIAWEALVPLFIGFLIIGLVLFKKMDRGSAIKKLIVRVVFIGVGLPLIGSMYTGVLNKFDDSLIGQHAGPTRVVLSTYVDFNAWMMNDRLGIPDEASISWDGGQAGSESMMSVRNTALAINKQSHGDTYADINVGKRTDSAEAAWRNGTVDTGGSAGDDVHAVFTTFGILNNYIAGREIAASDFESGIKTSITNLDVMPTYSVLNGKVDAKEDWFVNKASYGDVERFGEERGPIPSQHPVIATGGLEGLTSSKPGGNTTTFTTTGTKGGCGFTVLDSNGDVASCNLSALAAYNYLNTGFGPDSMKMYSSNKAMSGMTRESHMAVSQVGTGPAKFMYWQNAVTVLGCISLLGFWYAIGMLAGAVKRTFSLVAAVPFATLGAVSAIAKVIVYSGALILEVIVTLFIYQFVSELLISIPDIIAGPVSSLMDPNGFFGSPALGGIVVVLLTLVSSLLIIGVTFSLLKVRKVALQAMDEVFTKLVDKFLETSPAPKPEKSAGMPSGLANGAVAGVGAGQKKVAHGLGGNPGGGSKAPSGSGKTASTNAGGLNGQQGLPVGGRKLAIGPGGGEASHQDSASDGNGIHRGLDGPGDSPRALPSGRGSEGADGGGQSDDQGAPLQLTTDRAGSSHSAKDTAQQLSDQGGLSNLGYHTDRQPGTPGGKGGVSLMKMEKGADGVFRPASSGSDSASGSGPDSHDGSDVGSVPGTGSGGSAAPTNGGRKALPGHSSTRFASAVEGAVPAGAAGPPAPRFGGAIAVPARARSAGSSSSDESGQGEGNSRQAAPRTGSTRSGDGPQNRHATRRQQAAPQQRQQPPTSGSHLASSGQRPAPVKNSKPTTAAVQHRSELAQKSARVPAKMQEQPKAPSRTRRAAEPMVPFQMINDRNKTKDEGADDEQQY